MAHAVQQLVVYLHLLLGHLCSNYIHMYLQLVFNLQVLAGTFASSLAPTMWTCIHVLAPTISLVSWISILASTECMLNIFLSDPLFCFFVQCNPSPGQLHWRTASRLLTMKISLKRCNFYQHQKNLVPARLRQVEVAVPVFMLCQLFYWLIVLIVWTRQAVCAAFDQLLLAATSYVRV